MCWRQGRPDLGFLARSDEVCACDCGKFHTCCSPCQNASSAALSLLASSSTALPSFFSTSFFRAGRGPVLPCGWASCPAHRTRSSIPVCVSRDVVRGGVVRSAASRTRLLFCGRCFVGVRLGEYVQKSREMTGRCLLCNFDLGVDANKVQRTRSHTQRTCGLNSMPCRHALPVGHPFRKDGDSFDVECRHHTKCTKFPIVGHHVSTLVLSSDRCQMDNKTGNATRQRTAPPLSSSYYVCLLVTDASVAEWLRAHHAACWADWRQSQEAAAAAADIDASIHQSGM